MGSVMHPVGDRPAWVYWLRRIAVLGAVVAVVAVVMFAIRPTSAQPGTAGTTNPPTPTGGVVPLPTPTGPATSAAPKPKPSPTPTGPANCDASNSTLSMAGFQKVKQGGKQVFKISLANTSKSECIANVSAKTLSLVITSGKDRIWTTEHCAKWVPTKKETIKAGQALEFSINWGLRRSAANCKLTKDVIKPGTYVGKATLDDSASARQVFQIQKG